MRTAYRCRAYPDQVQQAMLNRTFGCVRVVWNRALAERQRRWQQDHQATTYAQSDAALTALKKDPQLAWLNEVSCVPLQQALRHQHQAFRAFFAQRARYPRHDLIAIEDLNVSGMVRNRRLARAISDCGWGEFRRQLQYKCQRAGRQLVVIGRWYPSSKICSACGFLLAELSLSTRTWRCPSCRVLHDRDLNAAKNILAAGLAAARAFPGDACGADVRHLETPPVQSAVKQEPQPVTAGIPVLQGGE
jgi:IS605 OrfB family transposase